MRKVTYQAFKLDPGKELKDLPFEIVMFGKPYARVIPVEKEGEILPEAASIGPISEEASEPNFSSFDWNTGEYCQSCRKTIPQILMPYHSHVVHGL